MTETLPIDGASLTVDQFLAVARQGCGVAVGREVRERVEASRRAVERAVRSGRAVYGVTTGFGSLSNHAVSAEDSERLQLALVRSHASGLGPPLPADVVRGMVVHRLNALARAHSGVRSDLLDRMVDLLNHGLIPWVPEQGSVGASGDLAPLAHFALALIGEGYFVGPDGGRLPAREVLAREGLPVLTLRAKEGVSLVNGTSLMESYLVLSAADAQELLAAATIASALSFDALNGDPQALDERLGALRNLPEQEQVARAVRTLIEGSTTAPVRTEYRGQDPYTLRCIPQVVAATSLSVEFALSVARRELNAVADNPIVFEGDEFVSGGNFHGQHLALALDTLALGLHYLGAFAERRVARLLNPALNRGLPAFLTPEPGVSSGLMIPQYLAAALVNENQTLVHPASAGSIPTSADQEDFVSMGAWAGAKLRRIVENVRRVVAVEWLVAGQALELRRPAHGGKGTEAALRALREFVPPWSGDRPPAADLERIVDRFRDGSLVRRVRTEVPFGL